MKNNKLLTGLIVTSFLLLLSCDEGTKSSTETISPTTTVIKKESKVKAPNFSEDSAFLYVEKQVSFGPRVPNTEAHEKCATYFVEKLKSFGVEVIEQKFTSTAFDGTPLVLNNIVGSVNPQVSKRILLAAHWDSRPFADQENDESKHRIPIDGANDGGSGVGVLMEVIRVAQLHKEKLNVGVDIILFDGEDYGTPHFYEGEHTSESWCLGSQYWLKKRHKEGYHAFYGILLDMVGAKDARFYHEGLSRMSANGILKKVWKTGHDIGYGEYFVYQPSPEITDDHVYMNEAGIPTIDIIDYQPEEGSGYFPESWHTHNDNMSVIDRKSLKAVGQTLLQVVFTEQK